MESLGRGDYIFAALCFLVVLFQTKPYLHIFQLEGYAVLPLYKSKTVRTLCLVDVALGAIFTVLWVAFYFVQSRIFWGFLLGVFYYVCLFGIHFVSDGVAKKPLVYTKRAVRFTALNSLVAAAFVLGLIAVSNYFSADSYYRYLAFFAQSFVFMPLFTISAALSVPIEKLIKFGYERKTQKILSARSDLIKIAITGSYGKTSVKNYLDKMLKGKYNVLSTQESYNTPMGIAKTVKNLSSRHEVFIAEMGARHVGDIKQLMRMVKPTFGILTGITGQHLKTFKTLDNIIAEKELVVKMLPEDGFAVVNGECEYVSLDVKNAVYVGFSNDCECYADNLICTDNGSAFYLHFGEETAVCVTPLVGRHNVLNIAFAAATAKKLGVGTSEIVKAIAALEPVPHRLQLLHGNGVTIIDDSFNSSVVGSRAALDTLALFVGRKIVLTPGLIELGDMEYNENFELGKAIAKTADTVLLIGEKRSLPLRAGLAAADFDKKKIFVFESLKKAQENFPKILHMGDVLLILNDLPDNYDE